MPIKLTEQKKKRAKPKNKVNCETLFLSSCVAFRFSVLHPAEHLEVRNTVSHIRTTPQTYTRTHAHMHTCRAFTVLFVADICPLAPLLSNPLVVLLLLKISFLTRSDGDVNNNAVQCYYSPEWNTDSLSFCPISLVFLKPFATGTVQGSTLEKTGNKMGIMTGLRGETETKEH